MRFLTIFSAPERDQPPSMEEMAAMGELIDEMAREGVLVTTEGCKPSATGARATRRGGSVTVTDGPFSEAKEVVGGFAILECASKDEAIAWTRRFMEVAGDGTSEIRELYDEPAYDRATGINRAVPRSQR
jgi:hypothetical protein